MGKKGIIMNRKAFGVITSICMGLGLLVAGPVAAEEGSDWEISGNVNLTNDYMYRGFSQTDGDFAIQGGLDVSHSSGFYVGVWGSNIDFLDQTIELDGSTSSSSVEIDLYGGFGGDFSNSMFSYDVGFIYYAYPGSPKGSHYDFYEFGATLGADFGLASVSIGAWWSPDFFGGIGDSLYIPIGIEIPIPLGNGGPVSLSTSANVAFNKYFDLGPLEDDTYINWDIGLTVSLEDWFDVDLRYYDTDLPTMDCKGICDSRFVVSVSRSF
ncbi:MAG: hypothetical protein E2O92_09680 [Alphaproteobacteria bacterium]|nr:MAG: hypothetical protein E2O92_09680 [Alphaproteobacteria bacterium]